MYNEFVKNITKENDPVRQKALYNEKTLIGRLHQYFLIYFETFSVPTADTLFLLILSTDLRICTFHLVSVSAFFIRNNGEITACILLCMSLCKGRLFQVYEYYCQDCFEADTGFIADASYISVCR